MLGATTSVNDRVRGLDSGADDFLISPFAVEEFRARVRALLRRQAGPRKLVCGELEVDRVEPCAKLAGRRLPCTARELAVLVCLAERQGEIVTRMELLVGITDAAVDSASNAVNVHLCHLRSKLGEHAWMIQTVRGRGYRIRSRRDT